MIAAGYYGELAVTGDLSPHWICWLVSMTLASYLVYELLVGPASATAQERGSVALLRALSEGRRSVALHQDSSGSLIPDETKQLQAVAQHRAVAAVQEKANSEAQGQRLR